MRSYLKKKQLEMNHGHHLKRLNIVKSEYQLNFNEMSLDSAVVENRSSRF